MKRDSKPLSKTFRADNQDLREDKSISMPILTLIHL